MLLYFRLPRMYDTKKLAGILVFYLILVVAGIFIGKKVHPEHGMLYGATAGVLLSLVLWFVAGKKAAEQS
jgi:membrane protein DedA with SNARE-associated domain